MDANSIFFGKWSNIFFITWISNSRMHFRIRLIHDVVNCLFCEPTVLEVVKSVIFAFTVMEGIKIPNTFVKKHMIFGIHFDRCDFV